MISVAVLAFACTIVLWNVQYHQGRRRRQRAAARRREREEE